LLPAKNKGVAKASQLPPGRATVRLTVGLGAFLFPVKQELKLPEQVAFLARAQVVRDNMGLPTTSMMNGL
jgi:hypothetical protein